MGIDAIRVSQMDSGGYLQNTDKLYAIRGSGVGADKYVTIPLVTNSSNTILGDSIFANGVPVGATENTLVGVQNMFNSSAGIRNAFFGYACGRANEGDYNTAMGRYALYANVTGDNNVALGASALNQSTGNQNIGLGESAGLGLTSGNNNIFIGALASAPASATSDYLNVGGALTGTVGGIKSLNSVGDFSVATNKVTIASATGNMLIAGTLGVTGALSGTSGAFSTTLGCTGDFAVNTNKFTVAASTGNALVAGTLGVTGNLTVNTNKFSVASSTGNTLVAGTLGVSGAITGASYSGGDISGQKGTFLDGILVNTTSSGGISVLVPSSSYNMLYMTTGGVEKVLVTGDYVGFKGIYNTTSASAANVVVASNGQLARSTSSRKFKENERPLEMNTSKIDEVVSCTFNMKDSGQLGHGPISEDIALVEPNFATYDLEGEPEAIHTNNLLYALILEHQKLKKTVTALEQRLAKLEAK